MPLASLFCAAFVLILGSSGWLLGVGFLIGYLVYDMTHFYVHHYKPKTRVGKLLRELHMRHHFQDHTRGFGVSAPFWDYVFRTPLKRR